MFDCTEPIDPRIVARAENLNPKSFPVGSVVYFLKNFKHSSEKYIEFGTVIDHYPTEIAIQLYEPLDIRQINGIPVKEFQTPTEWKKLPKGWTWNTELFTVERAVPEKLKEYVSIQFNRKDPASILKAISDGALVRVSENDHALFRSEIDSKHGWRIVREYSRDWLTDYWTLPFYNCYATWDEAQAELDAILAENKRQAELSDREWSIEQIDRTLDRWAYMYAVTPETKQQVRDRILALDRLDDVVIRMADGGIEWKYDEKRRWQRIAV